MLQRWDLSTDDSFENDDRFHILTSIDGSATVTADGSQVRLNRGDTLLLPACRKSLSLTPHGNAALLDMFLP
jgi:mannose-6-phosphate isomerase